MPALALSSTSRHRSVATISMRQPASCGAISRRHMASEYGSWPVEAAAHQIRNRRAFVRAAISAGTMA